VKKVRSHPTANKAQKKYKQTPSRSRNILRARTPNRQTNTHTHTRVKSVKSRRPKRLYTPRSNNKARYNNK